MPYRLRSLLLPGALLGLLVGCGEGGNRRAAAAPSGSDEAPVSVDVQTYPNQHPLSTETTDTVLLSVEEDLIRLVNDYRISMGLSSLQEDSSLRRTARAHSKHMAVHAFESHVNPEGDTPGDRVVAGGVIATAYGENLAEGHRTAQSVLADWLASPGHRENLIDPAFTHTGAGYWIGGPYGRYYTQIFVRR